MNRKVNNEKKVIRCEMTGFLWSVPFETIQKILFYSFMILFFHTFTKCVHKIIIIIVMYREMNWNS